MHPFPHRVPGLFTALCTTQPWRDEAILMLKRGDMEDKGLDMHGLHHEQWNRDRVPGFERLQWKRDVYVASDRRSCPCSDRRSGDEAAETAAKTSGDTLHAGYQQEVQEFQQAMQRKRDGRPFLCKAGTAPMSVPLWRQVNIVNIVNIVTVVIVEGVAAVAIRFRFQGSRNR